jgi:hypothetical protein
MENNKKWKRRKKSCSYTGTLNGCGCKYCFFVVIDSQIEEGGRRKRRKDKKVLNGVDGKYTRTGRPKGEGYKMNFLVDVR